MSVINLESWSQFHSTISQIREEYNQKNEEIHKSTKIVFRGQTDVKWKLETTLERYSKKKWSVDSYIKLITRCSPEIEATTGRDWGLSRIDIKEDFPTIKYSTYAFTMMVPSSFYNFMTYLRHHQFPSPLLDWSASPFVAAYFAFSNIGYHAEHASIYAYIERPYGVKGCSDYPRIELLHPYTKSHRRHFQQQSYYSVCYQPLEESKDFEFVNHENVFMENQEFSNKELGQDIFFKINIPKTEQFKALEELNDYNINEYNLMQSEDSLMKTIALREIKMQET